jgi:hypothetical protein
MGRKLYIAGAFSSLQNIESVTEGQAISNWQKVKGESGANLFETIVVLSEKISLIKYKIMKGGFGLWKKGNEIARLHNSDDFELANPEKDDLILFLSEKILEVLKISEASLSLELEKEVFIHPEKLKSSKDFAIATARCIEKLSKEKNIQEPFRFLSLLAIKKK